MWMEGKLQRARDGGSSKRLHITGTIAMQDPSAVALSQGNEPHCVCFRCVNSLG